MPLGIDANQNLTSYAGAIKAAGNDLVGRYLPWSTKDDPLYVPEANHLISQGLSILSLYESGYPTTDAYFTVSQGGIDAMKSGYGAKLLNQPKTAPVFFTVDYDADPQVVLPYFQAIHISQFHEVWPVGVYGSDAVCRAISEAGYASYFYVAYSNGGWQGSDNPFEGAQLRQGPEDKSYLGYPLDIDHIVAKEGVDFGAWSR